MTSIKVLCVCNGYYDYNDNRKRLSQKAFEHAEVVSIETKLRRTPWYGKYKIPHKFGYPNGCGELRKGGQIVQRTQCDICVSIFDADATESIAYGVLVPMPSAPFVAKTSLLPELVMWK